MTTRLTVAALCVLASACVPMTPTATATRTIIPSVTPPATATATPIASASAMVEATVTPSLSASATITATIETIATRELWERQSAVDRIIK